MIITILLGSLIHQIHSLTICQLVIFMFRFLAFVILLIIILPTIAGFALAYFLTPYPKIDYQGMPLDQDIYNLYGIQDNYIIGELLLRHAYEKDVKFRNHLYTSILIIDVCLFVAFVNRTIYEQIIV